MSSQANIRIGLFVVTALSLLVAGIVILGAGHLFRRTQVAETYIEESIQGLDVGSPVKLRGVPIGNVSEIGFVASAYNLPDEALAGGRYDKLVLIRFNLRDKAFAGYAGKDTDEIVRRLVADGLRLRMAPQGLTGTAYLEADFMPPARHPAVELAWKPAGHYIPSARSTMAMLKSTAERVMDDVQKSDPARLITEATGLISELRASNALLQKMLDAEKIDRISQAMVGTADNLNQLSHLTARDAEKILADLRDSSARITQITQAVNEAIAGGTLKRTMGHVETITREVRGATQGLPDTMALLDRTLRRLDSVVAGGQSDLASTLENLQSISENLKQITDNAKRYPSQLLFGEPPPAGGADSRGRPK